MLHDVGHALTTLSYLVDAVRSDNTLSSDGRTRIELIDRELSRLLELVGDWAPDGQARRAVDVRDVVGQVVSLAATAYPTAVTLVPGPPARARLDRNLLWRVVSNIVDNAIRAAGRDGTVAVAVTADADGVVIEVTDDGPGFGARAAISAGDSSDFGDSAPWPGQGHGPAGLGLRVVAALARSCGGTVRAPVPSGGHTKVRVVFPARLVPSPRSSVGGRPT